MTTLYPRSPYTDEELQKLYPERLKLEQVQILLRHGERSPVNPRFQNAGLAPNWPYCSAAKHLTAAIMTTKDWSHWSSMRFRRRLETLGKDDLPVLAAGPGGELDGICVTGELTDKGRETTLALGERLRHLYIDRLRFMPSVLSSPDQVYLRATPIARALESLQQCFIGMYPPSSHSFSIASTPLTIITRAPADETLFPNDANCRRFAQLTRAFAQRAADRWNATEQMDYLNKELGKWMPETSPRVKVDGHPRLSGIMDTINATLAHGSATRLPAEFYAERVREVIDEIVSDEWFAGYHESREYRMLGIGGLVADVVTRMVQHVELGENGGVTKSVDHGQQGGEYARQRGGSMRFAMSGCHDTTLAGFLVGLGAFEGEKWPPFTSSIAIELFKKQDLQSGGNLAPASSDERHAAGSAKTSNVRWWARVFGLSTAQSAAAVSTSIARTRTEDLTPAESARLRDHYVRLRYNDKPMTIPGCRLPGKHLEGDESFCTLEAFKAIADAFTPKDWKGQCRERLKESAYADKTEPAGFPRG